MGFAILWVMYFHIPLKFATEIGWFTHRIGFYGVDIFLFLSGLGVYFSLMKRPNVLRFYKARLVRILPAYVIVACVSYCLLRLDKASALDFFYYISGIGYWTRHTRFDWYIPTQLAFYLITPLFLFFYKKLGGKKQIIYTAICMSLSVPLCIIMYYTDLIYLWGTAVRLSVFQSGLNCYPALLMMPSFCLLVSLVLSALGKKLPKLEKVIVSPFEFFGKYSLELYLLHQRLQSIVSKYIGYKNQKLALIITLIVAPLLGMAIKGIRDIISKYKTRKKTV